MEKRSFLAVAAAMLLAGCSFVKLTPEGEAVQVMTADEAVECKRLGDTTVSLLDKVAGIRREPEKVMAELDMLARNSAAKDLQGNAVVPLGPPEGGQRTYAVYRCTESGGVRVRGLQY